MSALVVKRPPRRRYLFKKRWKRMAMAILDGLGTVGAAPWLVFRKNLPPNPQRILGVRIDSLGDAVLTLPAIQALAKRFPKAQIDFLVSPAVDEFYNLLFPHSKIIRFEKNWFNGKGSFGETIRESISLVKKLRASHYDLGIDFRGDLRSLVLLSLAKIPHRWGRDGAGGGFLLTRRLRDPYRRHEIFENLELVQGDEESPQEVEFPSLGFLPPPREKGAGKKIVIHIGAGYPSKRWPTANYIQVAKGIQEKGLGVPVFIGTEEEKKLLDPFREALGRGFINLTGKTNLSELLGVFHEADLYLGNDSGPAHLAALLNRKIVLIFSGTNDFRRWSPWSPKLRLITHPVPCSPCEEKICPLKRQFCLEEISVEEVFRALEEMLRD